MVIIRDGKTRQTFPDRDSEQRDQPDQNEFDIFDLQKGMTYPAWACSEHMWTHTTAFRIKA